MSRALHLAFLPLVLCSIVVGLAGNLLFAPPALAYAVDWERWDHYGMTYSQAPMQSYDAQAFTNGATAWYDSPAPIWFYPSGSYDIAMYDANDGANGTEGYEYDSTAGYCYYPGYYQRLARAYTELNIYYTSGDSDYRRQSVAAHELGHALGLNHSYNGTLMYVSAGPSTPQQDDIDGVNYIYQHSCT